MQQLTLFLCGDVMTGRGVDQILPHPSRPDLYEPDLESALEYVELAERASGKIERPVDFGYVFGDALDELERRRPDARIVNLETAVTTHDRPWPGKSIHYRMHPRNAPCLTAAKLDCCVLANNHVLDWGRPGLEETLAVLRRAGLPTAGAGRNAAEAAAPAEIACAGAGRVLVFALATASAGVPRDWAAGPSHSGVSWCAEPSPREVDALAEQVRARKQAGDVAVLSIHWGDNFGWEVAAPHRAFAHQLIDQAGIDLVHGHSSHHARGIEVYREKLILYGCGDLLNDYEGIGGHEAWRPDLSLMYFPVLDATSGRLLRLELVPTRVRRMRIERARGRDATWLAGTLTREGAALGTRAELLPDDTLALRWSIMGR
jgi:poly-gamma-glutamate synthesis protein (capsule biosynthesis protein)